MTNEEYQKEQSNRFNQRYGWVDEYNRETAWSWLDDYWDFNTEDEVGEELQSDHLEDLLQIIIALYSYIVIWRGYDNDK